MTISQSSGKLSTSKKSEKNKISIMTSSMQGGVIPIFKQSNIFSSSKNLKGGQSR